MAKLDFLKDLKEMDNFTFTENGAVALKSTGNSVLDAFGRLSAMQFEDDETILTTFYKAFAEDKELAMRLLFYVRDIRGGQGMRRVFRVIARNMAFNYPDLMIKNLDNFLFFGRGDDVICLLDTPIEKNVIKWVSDTLEQDIDAVKKGNFPSLLAKWLPSENASSMKTKYFATKIRKGLGISSKDYRKLLSKLREKIGVVESLMSQNKWDKIDFEKLPAKAAMIYSDAFMRHVQDNYTDYLKKLASGDAKVNSASLFPVDIVHKLRTFGRQIKLKDKYLMDAMWNALPNYFEGLEETGICCVDTSGSMSGLPIEVSTSLGIYCADKCRGPFKNHYISFSEKPELIELKGDNITDKLLSMPCFNPMNTNLEAVFDLILKTAVANKTPQEDLPSKLYIISDMQFDEARGARDYWGRNTRKPEPFMETMRKKFIDAGYTMPAIVYWNVRDSKCGMFQETFEGENCAMVSGYSPSLFKSVIDGTEVEVEEVVTETGEIKRVEKQKIDPMVVMKTTLMNERYDRVVVK